MYLVCPHQIYCSRGKWELIMKQELAQIFEIEQFVLGRDGMKTEYPLLYLLGIRDVDDVEQKFVGGWIILADVLLIIFRKLMRRSMEDLFAHASHQRLVLCATKPHA
ncbi:hypothetical protein TNIN_175601 [Trichonephila inaurata madagascariensis]|uniref:Uncharacterized protein n=1 Tax=Trichonephila inaurata madagascariensis TaxID=2747483 RepID=A0A8X6XLY3_9ARAC|nr:hypothetical protein TNIN_175601 [Trichonephila inaurata madagascariensis]